MDINNMVLHHAVRVCEQLHHFSTAVHSMHTLLRCLRTLLTAAHMSATERWLTHKHIEQQQG
jgi:hypothetical protein